MHTFNVIKRAEISNKSSWYSFTSRFDINKGAWSNTWNCWIRKQNFVIVRVDQSFRRWLRSK